eukprot:9469232-Pyramimonas_sp.AAC.1
MERFIAGGKSMIEFFRTTMAHIFMYTILIICCDSFSSNLRVVKVLHAMQKLINLGCPMTFLLWMERCGMHQLGRVFDGLLVRM